MTDGTLAIAHTACVSPLLSNGSEVKNAFLAMQTKPGLLRGEVTVSGMEMNKTDSPLEFPTPGCSMHQSLILGDNGIDYC